VLRNKNRCSFKSGSLGKITEAMKRVASALDDEQSSPKKSRGGRPRVACQLCKKLRVRCDGDTPCETCVKRGNVALCRKGASATSSESFEPIVENGGGDRPIKRGRRSFACDYCKRQRIRCNGERPCNKCVNRGFAQDCGDMKQIANDQMSPRVDYSTEMKEVLDELSLSDEDVLDMFVNHPMKW
jgi:hypothetical protein